MALAIVISAGLAAWYFLWESILAPSWRMNLRHQLFEMRDELRWAWIDADASHAEAFALLQESLNNAIRFLHTINFSLILTIKRELSSNPGLSRRIENRRATIDASDHATIHKVDDKSAKIVSQALVANIGGWLCIVVPILIILVLTSRVTHAMLSVLAIPERVVSKFSPYPNNGVAIA